jgi:glycerol-3-phosphate dehydrogenase (NAD(P)+)
MKIVVLGAGAWGTALAVNAAGAVDAGVGRHEVTLWARNPLQVQALQAERANTRYLPGIALPASLRLQGGDAMSLAQAVSGQDLIVVATPVAAARSMLVQLQHVRVPVAWLSKGFESPVSAEPAPASLSKPFGLMVHEVRAQVAPDLRAGVLSGPSFALEVARGQPTALVAASEHAEVRAALVAAFHSPSLRVYASDDQSASRSAAPSRTSWRLPPACATACNWA